MLLEDDVGCYADGGTIMIIKGISDGENFIFTGETTYFKVSLLSSYGRIPRYVLQFSLAT